MRTTIDEAGRIVIPKAIREGAGLRPGIPLEIVLVRGRIEILPGVAPTRIVDEGGIAVLVSDDEEPLSSENTRRIQEAVRGGG